MTFNIFQFNGHSSDANPNYVHFSARVSDTRNSAVGQMDVEENKISLSARKEIWENKCEFQRHEYVRMRMHTEIFAPTLVVLSWPFKPMAKVLLPKFVLAGSAARTRFNWKPTRPFSSQSGSLPIRRPWLWGPPASLLCGGRPSSILKKCGVIKRGALSLASSTSTKTWTIAVLLMFALKQPKSQ